jgi:hypothetical protein
MTEGKANIHRPVEEFLAELAAAAYRVSLRHGVKGSFLDLELDLWRELRVVLTQPRQEGDSASSAANQVGGSPSLALRAQTGWPGRDVLPGPSGLTEVVA